jgi:beta-lactamase regulating signal transducer with metallopeptidase domain
MTILLVWLWQGMAVALVTKGALRLVPRINAATRYSIWCIAYVCVVAMPLVHILARSRSESLSSGWNADQPALDTFALPMPPDWLLAVLVGAWLGSVLLAGLKIAAALRRSAWIRQRARPLDGRLAASLRLWNERWTRRRAVLRTSQDVASASAIGLLGVPSIVVSDQLVARMTADAIDQIVLHEQAHLARYDDWTQLVQACSTAALRFHPAIRFIDAQINLEREAACDEAVVARTGAPGRYAACLAEAADVAALDRKAATAVGLNALGAPTLLTRVERLLDDRVHRRGRLQITAGAVAILGATVALTGGPVAPVLEVIDGTVTVPSIHVGTQRLALAWGEPATPREHPGEAMVSPQQIQRQPQIQPQRLAVQPAGLTRAGPMPASHPATVVTAPTGGAAVHVRPQAELASRAPGGDSAIELSPLPSRSVVPAPRSASHADRVEPDRSDSGGAEAGLALGRTFGDLGTRTGARMQRAGVALGGFFSRKGKALAGSF